jgi:sporulation protein YlmC with PRC-barrel domain
MSINRGIEPTSAKVLNTPRVISINTLTKDRVTNVNGYDLGRIEDIMIDIETGRVSFAVLGTGGFISREAHLYAIPWQALKFSLHDKTFVLDITKEALRQAPSFTRNNWPDLSSLTWLHQVYAFFGVQPYWKD